MKHKPEENWLHLRHDGNNNQKNLKKKKLQERIDKSLNANNPSNLNLYLDNKVDPIITTITKEVSKPIKV